jgi:hypothetical protein
MSFPSGFSEKRQASSPELMSLCTFRRLVAKKKTPRKTSSHPSSSVAFVCEKVLEKIAHDGVNVDEFFVFHDAENETKPSRLSVKRAEKQ